MKESPNTKYAIAVSLGAAVVLVASFLPWGEIQATLNAPFPNMNAPFGNSPFRAQGVPMTFTVTGWNGHLTVGGIKLANWLVVVAAAGIAALSWLKELSVWNAPTAVPIALGLYGLLHSCWASIILAISKDGSVGIGPFLTAMAFIGMLVVTFQRIGTQKANAS